MIQILIAWFFADLITGFVHWWEDRYLDENSRWSLLRAIAADNDLHHTKPTAMLQFTWWQNIRLSAMFAVPVAIVLAVAGFPLWVWLGVFFTSFGNLVHRWSHTPKRQLPIGVALMQRTGLFISPKHHDSHHREMERLVAKPDTYRAYCPMTDWVNPVIDSFRLWKHLEAALSTIGIYPVGTQNEEME